MHSLMRNGSSFMPFNYIIPDNGDVIFIRFYPYLKRYAYFCAEIVV